MAETKIALTEQEKSIVICALSKYAEMVEGFVKKTDELPSQKPKESLTNLFSQVNDLKTKFL